MNVKITCGPTNNTLPFGNAKICLPSPETSVGCVAAKLVSSEPSLLRRAYLLRAVPLTLVKLPVMSTLPSA
jgi:hypothetical protein